MRLGDREETEPLLVDVRVGLRARGVAAARVGVRIGVGAEVGHGGGPAVKVDRLDDAALPPLVLVRVRVGVRVRARVRVRVRFTRPRKAYA